MYINADLLGPWGWLAVLVGALVFGLTERWYRPRANRTTPLAPTAVCAVMYAAVFTVVGLENGILGNPPYVLICGAVWLGLVVLLPRYFEKDRRWPPYQPPK